MVKNSNIKRFSLCLLLIICASLSKSQVRGILERDNGKLFVSYDKGKSRALINERVVTVKLKDGMILDNNLKILRSNQLGYIDLSVPNGVNVKEFAEALVKSSSYELVKYADVGETCMTPNDTYFTNQWYLSKINMPNTWNITTGSPNVKVAVFDLEVDWNHQDIGIGNDGYKNIDNTLGYNYKENTYLPVDPQTHGTFVAGINGAKTNNSIGIAGITGGNGEQGVTIIPYGVGSYLGAPYIDMSSVDDAILDAVDKGIKVINMSFGSTSSYYPDIDAAITYAYNHGVTLVAASGNDHSNAIRYPASHSQVIAVGAINQYLQKCDFSNYGTGLDLVAPGKNIYSTTPQNGYNYLDGTSFAAPQVSGVVALMLSVNPTLTPDSIRSILRSTCTKLSGYTYTSGWNNETGYGLLNAYAAVKVVAPIISGSSALCDSNDYSVTNLPSGASVSWNMTIDGDSTLAQLSVDTPAINQCRITRNDSQNGSFTVTLSATIIYQNDTITILSKDINAPAQFVSVPYTIINTQGSGGTGGMVGSYINIDIKPNVMYLLSSSYFSGKTPAIHGSPIIGNYMFTPAGSNRYHVMVPQGGNLIATFTDGCTTTTWSFWGRNSAYLMSIGGGDGQLIVDITENDSAVSEVTDTRSKEEMPVSLDNLEWTLEVYEASAFRKVRTEDVEGNKYTLDTTSLPKGIYIIRAIVGKEILSEKITMK